MSHILFIDEPAGELLTAQELLSHFQGEQLPYHSYLYTPSYKEFVIQLLISLHLDKPIVVIDSELPPDRLTELGFTAERVAQEEWIENPLSPKSFEELIAHIKNAREWCVRLIEGEHEEVSRSFSFLKAGLDLQEQRKKDVWGITQSLTTLSGLHILLQSILNHNLLLNLHGLAQRDLLFSIGKYTVTHLSGTSKEVADWSSLSGEYPLVREVTLLEENTDPQVIAAANGSFPNASFSQSQRLV